MIALVSSPARAERDLVMQVPISFSLGFMRPSATFRFGSNEKAFGVPRAGGSFGFADPDAQVDFAYAPNRMGFYPWDDPREKALRDAFYRCLAKLTR